MSLDAGDNDPVRFWRYVVAALDRVRPGIASELAPFLGAAGSGSIDGLVSQVINELALQPDDVFLVLDDYHVIDAVPVHDSVSYLLEHAPIGLHVVLASRADPPLPLARLRGRGELTELRAADLRFTAEEAGKLLRDAVGSSLDDAVVAKLAARTEGWAAGLQLAAVSLHDHTDVAAFVESFSGSHRYVLDYLTEEVLERQTAEVREFLLETSVLERLSGPLCDAVTGRTDSQTMLESIEKANLFLVSLDDVRGWWRNHQLFADLLRVRLQRQQPDRVFELHRNAARWYEEHGLVDEAIRHATTAGDVLWAARMIERHADAQLVQGEETTLQRWIAALPRDIVTARPRLLLAQTRFVLLDEVEELLDAAERAFGGRTRRAVRAVSGPGHEPARERAGDDRRRTRVRRFSSRGRRGVDVVRDAGPGRTRRRRVDAGVVCDRDVRRGRVALRPARGCRAHDRVDDRALADPWCARGHRAVVPVPGSSRARAGSTRPGTRDVSRGPR